MPSEGVHRILHAVGSAGDGGEQVARLCTLLARTVHADGVGLSVTTGAGHQARVAATDEVSGRIEDLQIVLGQGPCVDALSTRAPVLTPDMSQAAASDRWPLFVPAVAELGVAASFSVPLLAGDVGLGALDLYRCRVGDLEDSGVDKALDFAAAAVEILITTQSAPPARRPHFDVASWPGASTIHQATGMVMAQIGGEAAGAFAVLRSRAFADDRPLLDVARDVLDRRLRFDGA